MSQTTKEKTNKRSVSVDERTSEESKSSSTATTHAVSKAHLNLKLVYLGY